MAAQYLLYLSYLFLSGKRLQILEAAARLGPASDLDQPIFCRADACPRDPMEALQEGLTVAENRGNHQKSLQKKTWYIPKLGMLLVLLHQENDWTMLNSQQGRRKTSTK